MKKRLSTICALLLAVLLLMTALPLSAASALANESNSSEKKLQLIEPYWSIPNGYNAHDYNKIVSFLEQTDGNGIKNGSKINDNYDPNDPSTWSNTNSSSEWYTTYFAWSSDTEKRIVYIKLAPNELNGVVDFSGCSMLRTFICDGYGGSLTDVALNECTSLTSLELTNMSITEIDISSFTMLTSLIIGSTYVSSIDLSSNTQLTDLNLDNNRLVSLDVSDCPQLHELSCASNQISSLDLSSNPNLVELDCSNNAISSLDVSSNPLLKTLHCSSNSLGTLNLSNNSVLETIYCGNTNIKVLDLSSCPSIKLVNCSNASLEQLNVAGCTALEGIYCDNNRITNLDFSSCSAITWIDCSDNSLVELDVTGCSELSSVDCRNNQLGELDFSTNPKIHMDHVCTEGNGTVACDYSTLYATAIGNAVFKGWFDDNGELLSTNMEYYSGEAEATTFIARFSEMVIADYNTHDYSKLVSFLEYSDGWEKNGERLSENYDPADPATWGDCFTWELINGEYRIVGININHDSGSWSSSEDVRGILDVSGCTELVNLRCTRQQLRQLNAEGCAALVTLDCSDNNDYYDNGLNLLNISGCVSLESINCNMNEIQNIDVSDCPNLKTLYCGGNQLTCIDVSNNPNLETLNCGNNSIESLNLSSCIALSNLDCSYNALTELDVSNNLSLNEIRCDNNRLTSLNVSGLEELYGLYCENNALTTLYVHNCTSLSSLYCRANALTSLDLSTNSNLWYLTCDENFLTELDLSNCIGINQNLIRAEGGGTIGYYKGWWSATAIAHAAKDYAFIGWFDAENNLLSEETRFDLSDHYSEPVLIAKFISAPYNDNDFDKLQAFLDKLDSDGVKIGVKLNEYYVSDDPATWHGVKWKIINGEQRVSEIIWDEGYTDFGIINGGNLDLSGFTELESLRCCEMNISKLTVTNDTALKHLYCYQNFLTSLDVSTCILLEELECFENNIATLNISNCRALKYLDFGNGQYSYDSNRSNKVSGIDLSSCVNLETLDCTGNKLNSIDVSNCVFLLHLDCRSNNLSTLDVSANSELTELFISSADITSIDLSNNIKLKELYLEWTAIDALDLSNNPLLERLYIRSARFDTIDLSNTPNIEYCEIDSNLLLKTIILHDKTIRAEGIGYLNLSGRIATARNMSGSRFYGWFAEDGTLLAEADDDPYSWRNNYDLSETDEDIVIARFTGSFNEHDVTMLRAFLEQTDQDGVKNGEKLSSSYTHTAQYDPNDPLTWGCNDYDWDDWYGSSSNFGWVDVDGELRVYDLTFGYDWGTSIGLQGELNVSDCTALEYLYVYNNGLDALIINGYTSLRRLGCSRNNLSELDLSGCTAFESIECSNNNLTVIDLTPCASLTSLDIGYNKLTALDVSGCPLIDRLYCYDNDLTELDLSDNGQITSLWCGDNNLTELDVSNNPLLYQFSSTGNKLTELDFSNNPEIAIDRIYAEGNGSIGCYISPYQVELNAYNQKNGLLIGWFNSDYELLSEEYSFYVYDSDERTFIAKFSEHEYNENDTGKLLEFLERINPDGVKIGTLLAEKEYSAPDYDSDDPSTWPGVTWGVLDDELRVERVYWDNMSSWSSNGSYSTYFNVPDEMTLDLSGFELLNYVECEGFNLSNVDLNGCTALESLYCRFNNLSQIDVSGCTNLKSLNCANNKLTNLVVADLEFIETINCSNNELTRVSLSNLSALRSFSCDKNKLRTIDLSSCPLIEVDRVVANGRGTVGCYAYTYYTYLYAYPNEGETFNGWYNAADELLSTETTFIARNSEDKEFVAKFTGEISLPDGVTVSCNEGGEIEYSYSEQDDSVTVTWVTEEGYTCTEIRVNGNVIASNPSSPFVIENISQYAERDGSIIQIEIVFSPNIAPGDVNSDGSVNASDAILIMRYALGLIELSEKQLLAADVNGDGTVNASDAIVIMRKTLGLI